MAAITNTTLTTDITVKAREIDFVSRFTQNWDALREIMGIMDPVRKQPGTTLKSVKASITLADGVEMVMPGDNTSITVELIAPIAMEKGLRFAIREGGRTVASGRVTEVIE